MDLQKITAPFTGIEAGNWLMALVVAVISFTVIHGSVALFRRHLCKLSDEGRADRPAAELLQGVSSADKGTLIDILSQMKQHLNTSGENSGPRSD